MVNVATTVGQVGSNTNGREILVRQRDAQIPPPEPLRDDIPSLGDSVRPLSRTFLDDELDNADNHEWTAHARHSIHSANVPSDKREPNVTDTPEYKPPEVWVWEKDDSPNWRYSNTNRPVAGATHEKELPRGKHPLQLYSLGRVLIN
jgi:hypothetical protein